LQRRCQDSCAIRRVSANNDGLFFSCLFESLPCRDSQFPVSRFFDPSRNFDSWRAPFALPLLPTRPSLPLLEIIPLFFYFFFLSSLNGVSNFPSRFFARKFHPSALTFTALFPRLVIFMLTPYSSARYESFHLSARPSPHTRRPDISLFFSFFPLFLPHASVLFLTA